jgi:hypothetical protein
MERLNPEKLHVTFLSGTEADVLLLPRRYTLTHSDRTGILDLSIGREYNMKQFSGLYTRLMRDEVLAELCTDSDNLRLKVYCHVSGGLVFGTAKWRYNILQSELPLVLECIRYGDRVIFDMNPELDRTPVLIRFSSSKSRYDKTEEWGNIGEYK